jgi:hypothetical protein
MYKGDHCRWGLELSEMRVQQPMEKVDEPLEVVAGCKTKG